ncbi:ubiquitin-like-conjugating enzyme ATG10 isoform X2 [Apostichopus japonicus]|uniref:ubiquitin-like-conjugating enzyme ATG10 isoform X2 n=1 Tax=Stichopus japonicus TaxID=307972 RepID=UPI003AB6CC62
MSNSKAILDKLEFKLVAKEFAVFSEKRHICWQLVSEVPGLPFLAFKQRLHSREEKSTNQEHSREEEDEEDDDAERELEDDQATLVTERCDTISMEYHVVYSESYQVPVLYFNAFHSDGKLLSLNEIWDRVPSLHRQRIEHDKWTVITQQEHPIFGRPFFQLHPCHTEDLMKQVLPNSSKSKSNYIVTWLSSVGPLVGLHLPLVFSELCGDG